MLPLLAGILLLTIATFDVFASLVRTPLRSGPFTAASEYVVCRSLLALFEASGWRSLLALIGPAIIFSRTVALVTVLFIGWALVFSADAVSIVSAADGIPATFGQRLYYTGYSISTLGIGDYVPNSGFTMAATVVASLSGLVILTFIVGSISQLGEVVAAKNSVAFAVVQFEQLDNVTEADGDASRNTPDYTLGVVGPDLVRIAHALRTLPVSHRMHAERTDLALSVALDLIVRALRPPKDRTPAEKLAVKSIDAILEHLSGRWLALSAPVPDSKREDWRRNALDVFLQKDKLSSLP